MKAVCDAGFAGHLAGRSYAGVGGAWELVSLLTQPNHVVSEIGRQLIGVLMIDPVL